jgi:hypothetical protein
VWRPRSSERRLLLACVRRGADPAEIHSLLRSSLDWERVLSDATHHGIAPRVYSTLKTVTDETVTDHATVPPAVMERLAGVYYRQAALNGQFYAELRKILVACARAGIPVLVLKGAAIAEGVYGNIALRPMKDLDLLVRKTALDAADRLFRELGYVPDESDGSAAWYRAHHHHLAPYATRDGWAAVDLHHHIVLPTAPVCIPIEDLWRRARPASIASVPTLVFAPGDLLLHLCLDVSCMDRFVGKLRALCDLAATIERHGAEVDWIALLKAARDYKAERFVYYPLWLARRLVGAEIPSEVLRDLESSIRRPSLEDLCLRCVTPRAVLRHHHGTAAIPAWIMIRTCGDLLTAFGTWAAIKALHPLDLLVRAVRRIVRQRKLRTACASTSSSPDGSAPAPPANRSAASQTAATPGSTSPGARGRGGLHQERLRLTADTTGLAP